jgi:hypothetical protein
MPAFHDCSELIVDSETGECERVGLIHGGGCRVIMESQMKYVGDPEKDEFGGTRNPGYVVVKVPGRHYYGGLGQPWHYGPGEYEVYEVQSRKNLPDGKESLGVRLLINFPLRP